jgi:hypothetical protein
MTEQDWMLAQHEAGHACAAACQGLHVSFVSRTPSGTGRDLGYVKFNLDELVEDIDKDKARRIAIVLLCGDAMTERPVPSWPLSRSRVGNDEYFLAAFCDYLGLDEEGYEGLVDQMYDLTETRKFKRLFVAITAWLERAPRVDHYGVLRAMELAWL